MIEAQHQETGVKTMRVVGSYSWLEPILRGSGLAPGELDLPSDVPAEFAWQEIASQCGIDVQQLAELVAEHFGLPIADPEQVEPTATKFVPAKVALKHLVLPLRAAYTTIVVATSDPTNLEAEQDITFAAGRKVAFEIMPPAALAQAVHAIYSPEAELESYLDTVAEGSDAAVHLLEEEAPGELTEADVEAAPVVRLTNMILREAIQQGASDIHLQPVSGEGVVRFRVDGVLHTQTKLPLSALRRVVSRIKVMGGLDIANRLRPQDGRSRVGVDLNAYDLRISTVPTREAEKAVIRILDPEGAAKGLDSLGVLPHELAQLRQLLTFREGIVVVTGPTGSGKTTTLYGALRELATEEINIMTVEDPVEYELPGLTQIQVREKQGLTFASALRSILRQDPDVIFVGEIRDAETAEIALQASMTGHLVLATLHTNDAIGTIPRLADLGLDASAIAGSLRGSIAQRLGRTVCTECAVPAVEPFTDKEEELRKVWGVDPVTRTVGCRSCGGTGYRGRIPFVEALVMTPEIEKLILRGSTYSELTKAAIKAGMRPLHETAIQRVVSGETTLAEVDRVIGEAGDSVESDGIVIAAAQKSASAQDDRPQVLVVDDDGAYRTIARALLEKEGYAVSEAVDGGVALETLESGERFDLVVLDLDMPEVSGFEVLSKIRSTPEVVDLPIVVLTGSSDPSAEVSLLEGGADDYLRKPMDPERFLVRVKATLRRADRDARIAFGTQAA